MRYDDSLSPVFIVLNLDWLNAPINPGARPRASRQKRKRRSRGEIFRSCSSASRATAAAIAIVVVAIPRVLRPGARHVPYAIGIIRRGICTFLEPCRTRNRLASRAQRRRHVFVRLVRGEIRFETRTEERDRPFDVTTYRSGRRTLINKGYSKEIAIIYTVRARAGDRVSLGYCLPAVPTEPTYVCMHTCSRVSRDPAVFVPREDRLCLLLPRS